MQNKICLVLPINVTRSGDEAKCSGLEELIRVISVTWELSLVSPGPPPLSGPESNRQQWRQFQTQGGPWAGAWLHQQSAAETWPPLPILLKTPVVPSVSIQKGMERELHFLKRGSKNKRAVVGGPPLTSSIPRLLKDFADQKCTFPSPAPFPDQCKLSKGVQRHGMIRNKDPEKGLGGIWAI